jgi:hypothetical protein
MNPIRNAGIIAVLGLLTLGWAKLEPGGAAHTQAATGDSEIGCNFLNPRSSCAADPHFSYPVGDGLVVTLPDDFF